jgi:UDP-glucose 4-epimerase
MRVLVTGGAGFIGSHLVDALLEAGHETAVIDNLSTGRRENIAPGVRFWELDISDCSAVAQAFAEVAPEVVFHFAAQASVTRSLADPSYDAMSNLVGGLNVLQEAIKRNSHHFVFASTGGAIYGEPEQIPAGEDVVARPLCPYGVAKLAFEQYLAMFARVQDLSYTCLRFGNIFGPRQDPLGEAGVIAIFVGRLLRGEPPIVYGDGRQTRDYVYVGDAVAAALRAMELRKTGVFNIGTGRQTSVLELVDHLGSLTRSQVAPVFAPPRKGEVLHIALDASKARRELGWDARTDLREGLRITFEWHRSRQEDNPA